MFAMLSFYFGCWYPTNAGSFWNHLQTTNALVFHIRIALEGLAWENRYRKKYQILYLTLFYATMPFV